jgi:hypothetical protein
VKLAFSSTYFALLGCPGIRTFPIRHLTFMAPYASQVSRITFDADFSIGVRKGGALYLFICTYGQTFESIAIRSSKND